MYLIEHDCNKKIEEQKETQNSKKFERFSVILTVHVALEI